ncbi:MAG: ElyC/SanA/YdcF family protein [Meiothermus sp.]|nr:ElyC/SanA/YdcF family protein [Meiothermus sp.]
MRLPRIRKWWLIFPALLVLTPVGVWLVNAWVDRVARPWVFNDLEQLPTNRVGLVLGTAPTLEDGRRNLFFVYRMQAAAELYTAGKVEYLLVSGDNSTKTYDEPTAMRDALVALGVPKDRIYLDYAGFRTLDSVVRAEAVFKEQNFTVISQRFHNERAVFIARERGLGAVGYNARDVSAAVAPQVQFREYFARVQMVLDLFLLNTRPKFYGEPIRIGIDPIQ